MILDAMYKCRLCGKKFRKAQAGEKVATRCMGLADFLGWEKEGEE